LGESTIKRKGSAGSTPADHAMIFLIVVLQLVSLVKK
jgi:hypothetical protein